MVRLRIIENILIEKLNAELWSQVSRWKEMKVNVIITICDNAICWRWSWYESHIKVSGSLKKGKWKHHTLYDAYSDKNFHLIFTWDFCCWKLKTNTQKIATKIFKRLLKNIPRIPCQNHSKCFLLWNPITIRLDNKSILLSDMIKLRVN